MDEVRLHQLFLIHWMLAFRSLLDNHCQLKAYGVGEGRYRQFFGYKEGTRIFIDHLQRVNEICDRIGVQPMIWSDSMLSLHA